MSRVFNGVSGNVIQGPISTDAAIVSYTKAQWVKVSADSGATSVCIGSGAADPRFSVYAAGGGNLGIIAIADVGPHQSFDPLILDQWTHVAVTSTASERRLYINGVEVDVDVGQSYAGIRQTIITLVIGALNSSFDNFLGKIGRTSGWRGAATAGQIAALAAGGLPSAVTGLDQWFDYDPDTLTNQFTPAAGLTAAALVVTGSVPVDGADNPPITQNVAIRETFIDKNSVPRASLTGLRVLIWRSEPTGQAPDEVLNNQSLDATGLSDWEFAIGALSSGDPIWFAVVRDGSPAIGTIRKFTPTYF